MWKKMSAPTVPVSVNAEAGLGTLRVLLAELDRLTLDYQRRYESVQSKAALLVTGSAVVAGLVAGSPAAVTVAVIAASIGATVLGVIAMWPVRIPSVAARGLRDVLAPTGGTPIDERLAILHVYDVRMRNLALSEARLKSRAMTLRSGFVLLASALLPMLFDGILAIICTAGSD